MSFSEEFAANNIDSEKLIAAQAEFVITYKSKRNTDSSNYREFLDRDQGFTDLEKFINRVEWDLLRSKLQENIIYSSDQKDFIELLCELSIDPDRFILIQHEFTLYFRQVIDKSKTIVSYREYLESDQLLTSFERFINRIERELLQKKIANLLPGDSATEI